MKRRQRRQVLDINGEQSDSPRRHWQNKYEEIATDQSDLNGGPSNPLTNLLEQYNSDSEAEESKSDGKQLDDKVNDFLKEIQLIAPEVPTVEIAAKKPNSDVKECHKAQACALSNESSTLWQECFDDSTGYPYYWHVQTNEVTWEVPEEIRLLRERNQQDSLNRTSYSTQWVNFSANTYPQPQINIPEGMIPKEVVARNRNRQVSLQQNSQHVAQAEQNTSKDSVTKDDESDDGKIEMITSFGSDGSESETSENDSPMKKSSKSSESTSRTRAAEKSASQSPRGSLMAVKKTEIGEKSGKIGPSLPAGIVPLVHGPENSSTNEADREKWRRKDNDKVSKDEQHSPKLEQKFDLSLRNTSENVYGSTKLIAESKGKDDEREAGVNSVKELKFSLVPGYADDSDVEDDATPKKLNVVEPLFPIADYPDNSTATIVGQDGIVKKVEMKYTDSGSVRIFQYHSPSNEKLESTSNEVKQMNEELEAEVQETLNVEETRVVRVEDEPPKPNIFLENLETAPKAFQRKRRIAFDAVTHPSIGGLSQRCLTWEIAEAAYQPRVHYTPSALLFIYCPDIQVILNKSRTPEAEAVNKPETSPSPPTTCLGNKTDRQGLGVPKESRNEENENSADSWDGKTNSPITENPTAPGNKAAISFTKGETIVTKTKETVIVKEKTEEEINALKTVTETIMEKLRFLSEGGQSASAVQVMAIQLQTLLAAWEACELKDNYLENWLTGTGRELGRLEEAAAPPGWDCQWDRSHKRYFYRNSTTGDAQWTYPETDVIGGTEEMELCTTPPPQGQEEPCIIESQTEKVQEIPSSVESEPLNEETSDAKKLNNERKDVTAPPPPQISSPSPPPPPRIYAEDMKKGKKRRGSIQGTIPETKRDKCSAETNGDERSKESINPPLPPSPNKSNQPPLPPHPPSIPNPPSSEPLPPGVDPPDMPFTINAPSIGTTMLYTPAGPQTNPIYAATIGDPAILGHHTALMQGQLMHYPTYHQHLHNQALIAAANRLTGQEAVQFMVDYSQVYANTQVIAKPPTKSHKETLGSAIDSFYSDIATIENIRNDHETDQMLPIEPVPVILPQIPLEVEQPPVLTDSVLKERKKKKTKLGISKKQKEVSSMVAKWQKAQSYEDND